LYESTSTNIMIRDKIELQNELIFLEEQAKIRRKLISLPEDDDSEQQINKLKTALVPFQETHAVEHEKAKKSLEIQFLLERLRRMKIRTNIAIIAAFFCVIIILASLAIAYLNNANQEALILTGAGLMGLLICVGSSMSIKHPLSKTEVTVGKQD